MKRRDFLASAALLALLPAAARAYPAIPYAPGVLESHLDKGETVLLDFYASWCTTCAAQDRAITALLEENPAYGKAITFIRVDWDTYRGAGITSDLRIPRRSTLVVLKGRTEIGRLVAQTGRKQIRDLLDSALAAATA